MSSTTRSLSYVSATALGILTCIGARSAAVAQADAEANKDSEANLKKLMLEEVIVTAQRRAERLQNVPISVHVLDSATLTQQNLNSLLDVAQTVPSVRIQPAGRVTVIRIRGIGSGLNQAFDQSVGLFIDDIYHGRSRVILDNFLDIGRIEILKGPQTTLFGNNAIAGAFSIVTENPGEEFDASTRVLYGEFGQYAFEGSVGGPITDQFAARAAVGLNGIRDGWVRNVNTGERVPDVENKSGRLTLLFNPTASLSASLKVSGSENDSTGNYLGLTECPPRPPYPVSALCNQAITQGLPVADDARRIANSAGTLMSLDTFDGVLSVNYEREGHTLTSVSGYYDYDYLLNIDTDAVPEPLAHVQAPESYDQFSQELRLTSPVDQTIEYLAGLYYQSGHLKTTTRQTLGILNPVFAPTPLAAFLPFAQSITGVQDERSYAVFGSATWNMTDRLKLTGGARASWVEKDFDWTLFWATGTQNFGGLVPLPGALQPVLSALGVPGALSLDRKDDAVTPSAKIQYQLAPTTMAYASYSEGFKAGGFNVVDNSSDPTRLPFDPESVKAYEVGLKNELFDSRLLLNLAVFRSDYSDLQVSVNQNINGVFTSAVRNAAEARSQGVELEGQWRVSENFSVSTAISYLDAYFVDYQNAGLTNFQSFCRPRLLTESFCAERFPNGIGPVRDLSDLSISRDNAGGFAPKWSGSVTAAYSIAFERDYRLTTELAAYSASDYYTNATDDLVGAYVQLDGRLTLEGSGDRWALDLIGKNLTDEHELPSFVSVAGGSTHQGSIYRQAVQPRNLALQFRYYW